MNDFAATLGSTMLSLLGFGSPPVLHTDPSSTAGVLATKPSTATGRGPGRPPGSGSLKDQDMPLVVELNRRVQTGEAASPTEAARQLADQAYGPNTELESRAWRLLRRRKEYFSAPV